MKLQHASMLVAAMLSSASAGAVVPGFAGNITGGGNATPCPGTPDDDTTFDGLIIGQRRICTDQ